MTTIDVAATPLATSDSFYDQVETIEAILREVDFSTSPALLGAVPASGARWRPAFAISGLVVVTAALLSRSAF